MKINRIATIAFISKLINVYIFYNVVLTHLFNFFLTRSKAGKNKSRI
jgi:hypothetical protein